MAGATATDTDNAWRQISQHALCLFANLEQSIADTQLGEVRRYLNWQEADVVHHGLRNSHGIGNALILSVQSSEYSEIVTSYGDKRRSSGQVAQVACDEMKRYLASPAAVGEHIADQLLIPLALAGGTFTCNVISQHFKTNCEIIQKFVAHRFCVTQKDVHCHAVEISQ